MGNKENIERQNYAILAVLKIDMRHQGPHQGVLYSYSGSSHSGSDLERLATTTCDADPSKHNGPVMF